VDLFDNLKTYCVKLKTEKMIDSMQNTCITNENNKQVKFISYKIFNYYYLLIYYYWTTSRNKCFAILSFIKLSNLGHLKTQKLFFFSKSLKTYLEIYFNHFRLI
jgi:hypothetical protein